MSLQTVEIASHIISFDGEKTSTHRTDFNAPCDCQDCRNYYKHIENNKELVDFLYGFGIDYSCTEEVFSWDLGNGNDSLIHHEGHYGVFGKILGEEFELEKFGVKISFEKNSNINCDRNDDYFWLIVEGDFPYILEETREFPIAFPKNIFQRIKDVFSRKKRA